MSYRDSSKGNHGVSHRHFGRSKFAKNWNAYPLTGTAKGDVAARMATRREAEDRLCNRK